MADAATDDSPDRTGSRTAIGRRARIAAHRLNRWRGENAVSTIDHTSVLDRVHGDSGWSHRYAFMILMSAGIAILGLLLSSPAVIIGAMLISPLMGPIIGLGFALSTFDWPAVRKSLMALAIGSGLAIGFTAAVVLLSPLQDPTTEILARTRPNLFDLLVAVFSALAGTYATIRGRGETIVGVAIATALMPPLAVVGYGLATMQWQIFGGSLALYLTNFIAIALSATMVSRFYGFGSDLSPEQSRKQVWALLAVFTLLSLPLGWSLRQIAWETWATRTARSAIAKEFGDESRISSLDPRFERDMFIVHATVETDRFRADAGSRLQEVLETTLGKAVALDLAQIPVNQAGPSDAIERARQTVEREASAIASRRDLVRALELATGGAADRIVVDPVARRATVQTSGERSLRDWKTTELKLIESWPGWTIRIIPPIAPLPGIMVADTDPLRAPQDEILATAWAIQRWGMNGATVTPRQATGERAALAVARAEAVAAELRNAGLSVDIAPLAPIDRALEREQGLDAARRISITPKAVAPTIPTVEPLPSTPLETGQG